MSERLIGLNKHPGVRPVGVGKTWRIMIAKCALKVAGQEAKEVCGIDQLFDWMEEGIRGGIHNMRLMWQ